MAKRGNPSRKLNLIKEVLEANDKSQAWLAGELDVEFRTVNRYVNNHRQPSLELLFAIAKILKVNVKELINS
ncbi:MAG TPA: helix-turn-helix transcriptional regulator [Cyclobacteriaceae bacterium]|nr:helix-turn-helix transcriptional regulator [Cyclobacteriaceae bacterium]